MTDLERLRRERDEARAELARVREALAEMTDDRNEYLNFWRRHRAQLEDMAERDSHGVEPERAPESHGGHHAQ